jgi:hypothetical protein
LSRIVSNRRRGAGLPVPRSIRDFGTWLVELFRQHATRAQRRLIESCTDLDKLDTWFDRSLTATTAAEIIED